MKSTFEKVQQRLNLISKDSYQKSPEGYKSICSLILKQEGWTEEEYMGAVLSRVAPEVFV